jgi:hypothetical protein
MIGRKRQKEEVEQEEEQLGEMETAAGAIDEADGGVEEVLQHAELWVRTIAIRCKSGVNQA